ncbi:MAG TPA: cell division protein FtsB [Rhodanobacteraceae bacterium]
MKYWRWLGLLLIVLLIALQAKLWLGHGGMRGIHALRGSVAAQKAQNAKLVQRNQALAADVKDLKHGDQAVEARARNNLGLIKPGEVFYQVIGPATALTPVSGRTVDDH